MRSFFIFISGLLISQLVAAQTIPFDMNETIVTDSGENVSDFMDIISTLDIRQDIRLGKMLEWHIENNKKIDGTDGFRVEIFFSSAMNAREQALNKKKEFLSKYPDYSVHIMFSAPNFKVRVGDFRTKNEALKLYKKIQRDYPGAFIVPDIIDFPMLKSNNYE
jgi:hypothetical protein